MFSYEALEPQRYVMPREGFNRLFPNDNADGILQRVHAEQQEVLQQATQQGKRRQQTKGTRERIDYSSPEHAGEPHRGTISEAEKAYVRDHFDEVNERLRRQGLREIDPANPELAELYGLTSAPTG